MAYQSMIQNQYMQNTKKHTKNTGLFCHLTILKMMFEMRSFCTLRGIKMYN